MDRTPSFAMILALVFGAVFVTSTRPGRPPAARPEPAAAQRSTAPPDSLQEPTRTWNRVCGGAPVPLRPLCTALYDPSGRIVPQPSDWRQSRWVGNNAAALRLLLVTVADPDRTSESLRFDRAIESIQNAAAALGYSIEGYWIPWRPARSRADTAPDIPGNIEKPSDEPGVLVFRERNGHRRILVFLVGESPISGVRRVQFLNAIYYIDALSVQNGDGEIYIAGPIFSGSFPSLRKAIEDAGAMTGHRIKGFRIVSPSATVESAAITFVCGTGSDRAPTITYHSAVHSDASVWKRFREYASDRWGLDPCGQDPSCEQAVISESESAFGTTRAVDESSKQGAVSECEHSFDKGPKPPDFRLRIQFPRGISRLRNAYPEASARNLFAPEGAATVQQERLALQLRGRGPGAESVPSFSDQIPVAQETVLLSIATILRQQHIKFAQIVATDVYDAIFVAGFLRQAAPDTRVYIWNSDLMLARAAERLPLEGSLSVTAFPLIGRNLIWSQPSAPRDLRPMSSRYEMGLLRAVRSLLMDAGVSPPSSQHAPPAPRLWLTAIGSNGYWPIALLNGGQGAAADKLLLGADTGTANTPAQWPSTGTPTLVWSFAFCALAAIALLLGGVAIVAQMKLLRNPLGSRMLARWAAWPDQPGALGRAYFAFTECLVSGIMLYAIAGPVWTLRRHGADDLWTALYGSLGAAALIVALAGAAAPFVSIALRRIRTRARADIGIPEPHGYGWISLVVLAGAIAFISVWTRQMSDGPALDGFFFIYRSLDLVNGVCPSMPFLLLGAGFLIIAALHQRRFGLFLDMPPELPDLESDPLLKGLASAVQRVREPLGHAVVSSQGLGKVLAVIGGTGIFLLPWTGQQSLESTSFDVLYRLFFSLFLLLIVFTWARFLVVWIRLKRVLDRVACHPLQAAIAGLREDRVLSPTLENSRQLGLPELVSGSLNILRAFSRHLTDRRSRGLIEKRVELLAAADPSTHAGLAVAKLLSGTGSEIADALRGYWDRGCSTAPGERCPEAVRLGEQFIALQYSHFFRNATHQLRNLLGYVTTGFFLGVVSTLVYPFRSQDVMIWAAMINFVALGLPIVVAVVQMENHVVLRVVEKRESRGRFSGPLVRLALYGALPLAGIVSSQFPAVGRYLVWLLQPAVQALR